MLKATADTSDLERSIDRLADYIRYPRLMLTRFAQYARNQHVAAYRGRYDPVTGKPWAPLKPSTIATKKGRRRTGPTELSTLFVTVSEDGVTVGYRSPISPIQHFGARIPARVIVPKNRQALYWPGAAHPVKQVRQKAFKLPARPRVGFSRTDIAHFQKLFTEAATREFDQ